jgi:hypothetical protein
VHIHIRSEVETAVGAEAASVAEAPWRRVAGRDGEGAESAPAAGWDSSSAAWRVCCDRSYRGNGGVVRGGETTYLSVAHGG